MRRALLLLSLLLTACGGREAAPLPYVAPSPRPSAPDAGVRDAGREEVDAGEPDAGPVDAGTSDAGSPPPPAPIEVTLQVAPEEVPGRLSVRWDSTGCEEPDAVELLAGDKAVAALPARPGGQETLPSSVLPGPGPVGASSLAVRVACADGREATSAAISVAKRLRAAENVEVPSGYRLQGQALLELDAAGGVSRVAGCAFDSRGASKLVEAVRDGAGLRLTRDDASPWRCDGHLRVFGALLVGRGGAASLARGARWTSAGSWAAAAPLGGGSAVAVAGTGTMTRWGGAGAALWSKTVAAPAGTPRAAKADGRDVIRHVGIRFGVVDGEYVSTIYLDTLDAATGGLLASRPLPVRAGPAALAEDRVYVGVDDVAGRRIVGCTFSGRCATAWHSTRPVASLDVLPDGSVAVVTKDDRAHHLAPVAGTELLDAVGEPVPASSGERLPAVPTPQGVVLVGGQWDGKESRYDVGELVVIGASRWTLRPWEVTLPVQSLAIDPKGRTWLGTGAHLLRVEVR